MADTAHIYTPQNDSLEERVRAYRSVREAWLNAEASLKYMKDPSSEWCYVLGEVQEIEQAHEIAADSLQMATEDLSEDELRSAIDQGLMDTSEARELVQYKRQQKMQAIREGQQDADATEQTYQQD
jgi:hypothetical protein